MVKKSKLMKIVDWVINILLVMSFIIMMYFILWRIFGDSPTDFSVTSSVLGFIGMAFLKIFTFIFVINREVGELKIGVREGFRRIKEDIGSLKEDMNGVKKDIGEIKNLVKKK